MGSRRTPCDGPAHGVRGLPQPFIISSRIRCPSGAYICPTALTPYAEIITVRQHGFHRHDPKTAWVWPNDPVRCVVDAARRGLSRIFGVYCLLNVGCVSGG